MAGGARAPALALLVALTLAGPVPAVRAQTPVEPAPPAWAQTLDLGAQAFEAAYLILSRQHLRALPPRDLLQAAVNGLNLFLRDRGMAYIAVPLSGVESRDLPAVREAVARVGMRLGTPALALDAGHAAIEGMIRALEDPFTRLLHPTAGRQVQPAGYGGVGVVLDLTVHPPVVTQVTEGGPAQRAGVRRGDIVMEVDGRSTVGMPPQDVVRRLRGLPGTTVTIRLRRGGHDVVVTLVRELIGVTLTTYRRIETVGYMRLREFEQGAGEEAAAVLAELMRAPLTGVILDLRGNPGGYVEEAVRVASLFLAPGSLVTTLVDRRGDRTRYPAVPMPVRWSGPVVVLVDRESASAAEMVAGALQDAGAPVVGVRTFGKGTVQVTRRLPGGSVLRLSVARYLTPHGTLVDGVGIQPGIEAEAAGGAIGSDDDRALLAALQLLGARAMGMQAAA